MSDTASSIFSIDPVAALSFGFLGLALLMAYLGFNVLNKVIAAPNPRENVIKLARLFMYLSFALLIAAGPLQFGLLWAQSIFPPKGVKLTISLANTTWKPEIFGEPGIMKAGVFHPFAKSPLIWEFGNGGEINVQLDKVETNIELMQAQVKVASEPVLPANAPIPLPLASDPEAFALNGG